MAELIVIGVITSLFMLLIFSIFYTGKSKQQAEQEKADAKILEKQRNAKRPANVSAANVWLRKFRK